MTPSTTSWVVEPWSGETPLCFHGGTTALSKFQVEMDARHKTQHRHVFASWSFWRSVTWSSFIRPTNTTFTFYLQLAILDFSSSKSPMAHPSALSILRTLLTIRQFVFDYNHGEPAPQQLPAVEREEMGDNHRCP
jgi:hypothetical protein